ncbi:MAG: hypothetical protein FD166_2980 [Bacteroidetes bacterium]|nr:MAG: hypothetical protein FD166_2980 [Bacteroidota bacterium]
MKKEDLKPGDKVHLAHDSRFTYTYLGEWEIAVVGKPEHRIKGAVYGVFAHNPQPTYDLKTVLLPYEAVMKS